MKRAFGFTLLLSLTAVPACGGSDDAGGGVGGAGGDGGKGSGASGNGGSGNVIITSGTGGASGAAGTGVAGGEACATDTLGADVGPVNMFVMFDSSASMNDNNKWPSATAAFTSFFQDPQTAGLRLAFRFFGSNQPTSGCNDSDCSIDACADPLIDIAGLTAAPAPGDAHEAALVNLLTTSTAVGGFGTPIYPALGGAVQWASEYAAMNPGENAVVIFVTDGEPNGCNENIDDIAQLAADGWNEGGVRTYAIGLEGSNEAQLDQIAAAGNTTQGYFIGAGASAEQELLAALNEIRGNEIRCDIDIPPSNNGMPIDFTRVNVNYTPSGGGAVVPFGRVANAGACMDLDAWYYDDPNAPTQIILCDAACEQVNADGGAELGIVLGCLSEPPITR